MKKRLKTFWNLITLTILLPCFISSVSPQAKASEVDWIGAVAWSPNGQLIASATSEGSIKLLTANGDLVRVLQDANGIRVSALAWHPNGTRLASVGVSAPTIWDVSTGNDEIVMDFGHSAPILDVDWSPDGTRIATASFDSYPAGVIVWNAVTGEQLFSIADGLVDSVAWSPDSSRLAVGKADGIEIWDPSGTGTLVSTIETSGFQISVDWNPTGNLIAAASVCCPYTAGVVNIFNVATGLLEQTFSEHTDFVSQVAWNPDGTRLASTGYDGAIYIREVAVNQSTLFLQGTSRLSALDWSPDGSQLAFGGESSTFEILQVPNMYN